MQILVGIFALAERLPTSATLPQLKNKFPFKRMRKDSGAAKHEENTAKEKVAKERESESESGLVTWCKGIIGIGLFITVIKNIISGVTDVMIKTTFHGMNPITLVFLRY